MFRDFVEERGTMLADEFGHGPALDSELVLDAADEDQLFHKEGDGNASFGSSDGSTSFPLSPVSDEDDHPPGVPRPFDGFVGL